METSLKTKVIWAVLSVIISGVCIYCMVEPLHQTATTRMKEHLQNSKPGPFDEAMMKSLGMSDYPHKPDWNAARNPKKPPLTSLQLPQDY